ncbi:MAG: YebC/PmpR family DNA-binding transcriptional regulator, partial [Candidatus Cloacimonetes bacterium]|nr:YebC/PmpR family DNA-binding transcriptional regulator [Candidatus Cloacimonadota bacterium]
IDTLTDNKNRTAGEVRSTLTKHGGSLGTTGSVSYMFQTKGVISYDSDEYTEDDILEVALENGAEDISADENLIEVITEQGDFNRILEALQDSGLKELNAGIEKIADTMISLDDDKTRKVLKLIDKLEDLDDVQQVSTNLDVPDDFEDEE